MSVAIIKYNAGNVQSVLFALERLGVKGMVTDQKEEIKNAERVIFPGVGEAGSAMAYLKARGLDDVIKNLEQPVLGICLGMQLLCKHSEERDTRCMGVFEVEVKKFVSGDKSMKIPQMGWNSIHDLKSPLFEGIPENSFMYLVHSYYADLSTETIATCDYTQRYSVALKKDNFYGVQFHPEKSADVGEKLLRNFLDLSFN